MPVVPNNGKLFVELDSPEAVAHLVQKARTLDPAKIARFASTERRIVADIEDHLLYLSAIAPEWFEPFREEAVAEMHDRLPMAVGAAAVLLAGADDSCLTPVADRLNDQPTSWTDLTLLAGVGGDTALTILADHVRSHPEATEWANRLGVHVPSNGPAERRFTPHRFAILSDESSDEGTIGLSLDEVTDDPGTITWHYLSFRPSIVSGLPPWPYPLLHIVSPRTFWFTLHASMDEQGRYTNPTVDDEGEPFTAGMAELESSPPPPRGLQLRRYDADLTYRNGHIHLTPGICGTAGGPPIGIYPNPVCPECGVLMFHCASIESSAREYGEGFRSVFYCETCIRAAVTGTNWN